MPQVGKTLFLFRIKLGALPKQHIFLKPLNQRGNGNLENLAAASKHLAVDEIIHTPQKRRGD